MTQVKAVGTCSNGHYKPVYAKGLCAACYRYAKRNGGARPESLIIRLAERRLEERMARRAS